MELALFQPTVFRQSQLGNQGAFIGIFCNFSEEQQTIISSLSQTYENYFDSVRLTNIERLKHQRRSICILQKAANSARKRIGRINDIALYQPDLVFFPQEKHSYATFRRRELLEDIQNLEADLFENSCYLLGEIYFPLLEAAHRLITSFGDSIALDTALQYLYIYSAFHRFFPPSCCFFIGDYGNWTDAAIIDKISYHPYLATLEHFYLSCANASIVQVTKRILKLKSRSQLYYYMEAFVEWAKDKENQIEYNHLRFLRCLDLVINMLQFLDPEFNLSLFDVFCAERGV